MSRLNSTSTDELNVLLALNGNQRLLYLEEEIFSNRELACEYLHRLCEDFSWYSQCISFGHQLDPAPNLVYYYAYFVLDTRWLSAEQFISNNKKVYNNYCSLFSI